jgi:hypothetical protein
MQMMPLMQQPVMWSQCCFLITRPAMLFVAANLRRCITTGDRDTDVLAWLAGTERFWKLCTQYWSL